MEQKRLPIAHRQIAAYQQVARQQVAQRVASQVAVHDRRKPQQLQQQLVQLSEYAENATAQGNHVTVDLKLPGSRIRLDNGPALQRQSENRITGVLLGSFAVLAIVVSILLT